MSNTPLAKYSKSKNTEYEEYSASKILRNLIEFSINDSANKISIKIERNGLSLIEIKNNGNGLSSKDLAESVENNSVTFNNNQNIFLNLSKISNLEIISKEKDKTRGSLLKITNDKIQPIKECYADIGTKISLKDIFYNDNEKRTNPENFIEDDIKNTIFNYALAFPNINFLAKLNNTSIINTPIEDKFSKDKIISRISKVFDNKIAKSLIKEQLETEKIKIKIYYSNKKQVSKKKNNQYIIVNNKPARFLEIKRAFNDIYRKSFEVDGYPSFFIFLNYNENLVDRKKVEKMTKGLILKSFSLIKPAISQCPVVESLPFDFSANFPTVATNSSESNPFMSVIFPKPNLLNVGRSRIPIVFETLEKVLAFSSPCKCASGAAPTPKESMTISKHLPI